MNEPKLPDPTCPDIDSVIKWIGRAFEAAEAALRANPDEQTEELAKEIQTALDSWDSTLEGLRDANNDLRVYGEYWKAEADKAKTEKDEAESDVSELKSDKASLESDLLKAKEEIKELRHSEEVSRRALVG